MGFFEELPDLPTPPPQARNPKTGASHRELPVGVPLSLLAGRSDSAALVLGPVQAYSDGFEIGANLVVREADQRRGHFFDPFSRHHERGKEEIVRLAFVFADGSTAEALRAFDSDGTRALVPQGGSGGSGHWSTTFWCWPLPPPGRVEVVCAWPLHGIAETRTSFDAEPILAAAAKVERLWPEPPPGSSHSSTSHVYFTSDD